MLEVIHTPTLTSILGFSFFYGENMLTQERLKEILDYDPATGVFTWVNKSKNGGRIKAGDMAGTDCAGYRVIRIDRKGYKAHRLVWLYLHGVFPDKFIDHLNHDKKDNRVLNLREVSLSENSHNQVRAHSRSKTKILGVTERKSGKFEAAIGFNGKVLYLGTYLSAHDAHQAYLLKKREIHAGCTI